jgi:glucuronoarabinoxylan endo-1,4-beta-xylanase
VKLGGRAVGSSRKRYWCGLALVATLCLPACRLLRSRHVEPVTINWNTHHQTIDGFGASATGYAFGFTPQQANQFFNAEGGLGLSLVRLRVIPDTKDADCDCVANSEPNQCVHGSTSQILSGDLQVAQEAAARGARLIASPWSPPGEMKSSGKYCSAGSMLGTPDNYAKYADDLADFLVLLRGKSLSVDALSIQNEPDMENEQYDTCRWTGKQIHDFIPVLSHAISKSGQAVKIAAPEQSSWAFDAMIETLNDPPVDDKVGLVLGHAYGSENPSGIPAVDARHVWQTEVGDSQPFDGSMQNGLRWARSIHNYMTIGANAWMYWSLSCGERHFNGVNNMCLTGKDGKLAKRAYVLGQYAKFIRPGWQRIGVTNDGPLLVTAYRGPGNEFAIVTINPDSSPVKDQKFELPGVTASRSTVTPWITSTSLSLAAAPTLSLAPGDAAAFTYTIPASSVVTFKGKAD